MKTIRTFINQFDAGFAMSLLQANGFEALLLDEASFQFNYAAGAIPILLQVPEDQATEAVQFLEDYYANNPTPNNPD